MIRNLVYGWRNRRMDHAISLIGEIVTREPSRVFPGVELRERTGLPARLLYRTLESLVETKWLDTDTMRFGNRNVTVYQVTDRGRLLFRPLLNDSSGDDDIHTGDNSRRQVAGDALRVERVDEYSLALISDDEQVQVVSNAEFGKMLAQVRNGTWDEFDCHSSVPRIRT